MKIVLLLLTILSFELAAKQKELYFLGGGGEPLNQSDTMFDSRLKQVINFAKKSDWKMSAIFNGGHKNSEKILKNAEPYIKNGGPFTADSYKSMITEIREKLLDNRLKAGDQVMFVISTHGAKRNSTTEKSHEISVRNNFAVNVDDLESILTLAVKKNVQIALIDLSCHSGNTINIANNNSCVITSTGEAHYAYSNRSFLWLFDLDSFGDSLTNNFKTGQNLEDIFIKARRDDTLPLGFPMISTSEGKTIKKLLYELITPYLYFHSEDSTKLKNFYMSEFSSTQDNEKKLCFIEQNHQAIQNLINSIEKLNPSVHLAYFDDLRQAIIKYQEYHREFGSTLLAKKKISQKIYELMKNDPLFKEVTFVRGEQDHLAEQDLDQIISFFEKSAKTAKTFAEREDYLYLLNVELTKKRLVENAIAKLAKEDLKKIKAFKKIISNYSTSLNLATDVGEKLNKLYVELYTKSKKVQSNPCRDFTL